MSSLNNIKVNLTLQKKLFYEAQAAQENKSLSAYLRDKLEADDILKEELLSIKQMIEKASAKELLSSFETSLQKFEQKMASSTSNSALSPEHRGIQLEMLLLLRYLVNPGDLRIVQSELRRQNIQIWDGLADTPA